jgi:hypothetical protein
LSSNDLYDDVVETLETERIGEFSDAFSDLLAGLEAKTQALGTATARRR